MPKFSANLGFLWPDRSLLARIAAAAQAGFKAVELHWPYDIPASEVHIACAEHGVRLLALNTPLGDTAKGEFGLAVLEGRQKDFETSLDQAIDYARTAGASAIHVMAGVVPVADKPRARQVFAQNLALAAQKAADFKLLLEPINQRDKPGYFYSTLEEAASLIAEIGASNLKIMFDVYHVGVSQGDIFKRLEHHLPMIGHVQIAAVPSRAEPDEGEIAYPAVFAELDRLGYSGWVGCEYKPRGATDDGLSWVKTLGVSLEQQDSIWNE
ncbi:TIM barrel protein [Phyllobacterium sp. 628]|uniref:hydroxypyruvate isomerase family protein n=1 Tax=Phyllobacterium sp. 628 TaxID=2718938 RepID=UPI00166256FF|nr:TIM barrel protein [Phyllobacterium sp. 628]QND50785.1 TIM barrel protein [Phyllobacterium sp. 628]